MYFKIIKAKFNSFLLLKTFLNQSYGCSRLPKTSKAQNPYQMIYELVYDYSAIEHSKFLPFFGSQPFEYDV